MDEGPTHDPKAYRHKTMDNAALGGCIVFSLASVGQLVASFVPFALADRLLTTADLRGVILWCTVWAVGCGLLFAFAGGIAGLLGTLGGLIPSALFVHLRVRHALLGLPGIEGFEPARFPASSVWTSPLLIAVTVSAISCLTYLVRSRRK